MLLRSANCAARAAEKSLAVVMKQNGKTLESRSVLRFGSRIGIGLVLMSIVASPCRAQTEAIPAADKRTLELVDQLKDVIQKSERDPRSDQRMIRQLRDLVQRYDWPWRVALLNDDFRDGDYTYNPIWTVRSGDFWVARGSGLRTSYDANRQVRRPAERRSDSSALGLLEGIITGRREADGRVQPQQVSTAPAEIYTPLKISNAFAIKMQINVSDDRFGNTGFEFGPYLSDERESGYRLIYEGGPQRSFTLLRVAPRRSAVIETYEQNASLEDGKMHLIEWRRTSDGEMVVLLDDKEIMRTTDRGYSDAFAGFTFVNRAGDYELKRVAIFGSER